jgi:hypothetical protein
MAKKLSPVAKLKEKLFYIKKNGWIDLKAKEEKEIFAISEEYKKF